MRLLATLGITLGFVAGVSYAETFSGRLMDAGCYNTNKVASQEAGHKTYDDITKTCAAKAGTTAFALRVKGSAHDGDVGNTFKFDDAGNTQAAAALQNGTLKADSDGDVHVRVSGKVKGETFEIKSIKADGGSKDSTVARSK